MTDTHGPIHPGSDLRAVLIYNPRSGTHDIQAHLPPALQVFREHGWQVEMQATQRAGDVQRLAAEAVRNHYDVVLAAGGDGSLNEAANALAHSDVALATLPSGTANVWARQIGMPIPAPLYPAQLTDAARSICSGLIRPIDLGCTNERYFLLWSGAGLDAYVTSKIEPRPPWVKRWGVAGYGLRAVWYALRYRGTPMTIEIDDQPPRHDRAVMVLISNIQLYAGIVRPSPTARVDDGLLDVCIFKGNSFAYTAWHFGSIALRRSAHNPELIQLRGRQIRLNARQPTAVHVDAEPIGVTPIDVHIAPRALRVIVPQVAPAALFSD
ncbi:MAG TPA: diacylglycerol kinase family protein [Anaerolineae bacterium]|nr:diacylglycerol kinase family protein [Anaerolineae bacterium]